MLAFVIALLLPAGASAFSVIPPSNSGADQYVESVPTAGGSRSSTPLATTAPSTRAIESVTPSTQAVLVRQGADGRRTAALARRFAPPGARQRSRSAGRLGRSSGGGSSGGGSSGSGSSPLGTLVDALIGSGTNGGSGAAVPIALILSTFGVGAVALRRRRSG
jgi:hypothetical protein